MTTTDLGLRPLLTGPKGRSRTIAAAELAGTTPAELVAAGYERLVVDGPVTAGRDLDEDLLLLRFLREATSHTLRMEWTLGGRPLVEPRDLVHLVPPTEGDGPEAAECVAAWRADYRYGTYHYRQGPGFVTVKDVRPGGQTEHLTIDGDGAAQFRTLVEATALADLDADTAAALDDAVEYGLAVRGRETLLMLPYRMRRWPVPYSAI